MSDAAYQLAVAPAAKRALGTLLPDIEEALRDSLHEVAGHEQPTSHPDIRPLSGNNQGRLRLRVGEYRAVLELDKPRLLVLTIDHRETVYDRYE